jgi:hypothetical protein
MEQYIVFAGENFYPLGGWCDYIGSYPTVEEAREAASNCKCDWWQIVDITTKTVVEDRGL